MHNACVRAHVRVCTCMHVRACERVLPLEWVPVYQYTYAHTGIPYRGNPYRCTW